jgi:hypothetical protein
MKKTIVLLKVNHAKDISGSSKNLHFPVLNDSPLENYTLVQATKFIEINDDLHDIFTEIISSLYLLEAQNVFTIYLQPMRYQYDPIVVMMNKDNFELNDFSNINVCYFKPSFIERIQITQTIDNAKCIL